MELPFIEFDGVRRHLPILPGPSPEESGLPLYGAEYGAGGLVTPGRVEVEHGIMDQGDTQACGGYSACYLAEGLHQIRSGGDQTQLSPTYLWSKCNGGRNQGVILSDVLKAGMRYGVAPLVSFPANAYAPGQGSPDADQQAARFRFEQGKALASAAQIVDAISRRMMVVIGVMIGQSFTTVDGEGVSGPVGRPIGGHALLADEVYVSQRWGLCVGGPNSWGLRFGIQGRYRIPVNYYFAGRVDAYTVMSLIPDPAVDGLPVAA